MFVTACHKPPAQSFRAAVVSNPPAPDPLTEDEKREVDETFARQVLNMVLSGHLLVTSVEGKLEKQYM